MSQNKNKMSIIPILNFRSPCLPSHSICLGWKSALKHGRPSPELAHTLFTACSLPKHLTYNPDHLFPARSKVSTVPNLSTNSETLEYKKGIDHPILKSSYLVKTRKPMIVLQSTRETTCQLEHLHQPRVKTPRGEYTHVSRITCQNLLLKILTTVNFSLLYSKINLNVNEKLSVLANDILQPMVNVDDTLLIHDATLTHVVPVLCF